MFVVWKSVLGCDIHPRNHVAAPSYTTANVSGVNYELTIIHCSSGIANGWQDRRTQPAFQDAVTSGGGEPITRLR
jgi:hypothetical protein